eukprot:TRINITY_DN287_c0_g2_i1.p1 TRINITY_DN287_c0_g2~~TRINITY_DN287_c0_g2_i1.p1  ORF type:complete len:59 (-),score=27.40 TRINITY_DN287_c0_g2_i1:15-191(-)
MMAKTDNKLKCNKKELAATLSKVTQDFASELKRVNKRNKTLESSVAKKEKVPTAWPLV